MALEFRAHACTLILPPPPPPQICLCSWQLTATLFIVRAVFVEQLSLPRTYRIRSLVPSQSFNLWTSYRSDLQSRLLHAQLFGYLLTQQEHCCILLHLLEVAHPSSVSDTFISFTASFFLVIESMAEYTRPKAPEPRTTGRLLLSKSYSTWSKFRSSSDSDRGCPSSSAWDKHSWIWS